MATQPTELYDFSNDTGLTIPDTETVRAEIVSDFKSPTLFGPNIDTSEETHIGRLIDEITELVVQTTGVNAQNANQFNLNYATGTFLDNLGAAYGVSRVTSSHTQVTVQLTCSTPPNGSLTIPQGTLFTSDDEYDFALNEDVVVTSANAVQGNGTTSYVATGVCSAVVAGKVYCPAGTLTTIKTAVPGLVSVTNPNSGDVGHGLETDAHYRNRIKAARSTGASNPSAILNAIYALRDANGNPLVSDAVVLENGHAYPVVKNGIALPAHAIYVCVTGDDGSGTSEAAIAGAIYRTKTAGADYTKTTVSAALIANRRDITVTDGVVSSVVSFFRPVKRGLTVNLTADVREYAGTDAKAAILTAIQDYLTAEGIGAEISEETLVTAIAAEVATTIKIKALSMQYDGQAKESVALSAGEAFTTATGSGAGARLVVNAVLVG